MVEENLGKKVRRKRKETNKKLQELYEKRKEVQEKAKRNRDLEGYKFEQFKRGIQGKRFFYIEHADALNLPYDIFIHLSAKGSGKTTSIYRKMVEIIEKGEKFMYGRVYKDELNLEVAEMNERDDCPVYGVSYLSNWFFFKKSDISDYLKEGEEVIKVIRFNDLKLRGYEYVGRGFTFLKSNCLSGGKYEKYNTIIFDEILSYNTANRVSKQTMKNWGAAIHTIQRDKPNLKVYCFGNLQDVPDHPFLNYYGIKIDDDFRYIERGEDDCSILYLNSGGLYENTIGNKKGACKHADIEHEMFLKYNKVVNPTDKILDESIYEEMEFKNVIALSVGSIPFFVELRKYEEDEEEFWAIRCNELKKSDVFPDFIKAEEPFIYNSFSNVVGSFIRDTFKFISHLYECGKILFSDYVTINNFDSVRRYNLQYLENSLDCRRGGLYG